MRFDPETVPDLLGPEGPLAAPEAVWEDRPDQRAMALEVARLLEGGGRLAVEAPTGIGKSLAYGLPAALYARAVGGPVVISTHTRALQEQLLDTEAPRIRRIAGDALRVEILKGRNNYLCRRRYEEECRVAAGEKTTALLARLRRWVERTESGDFAESGERDPADLRYLALKVASDPRFCAHRECTPDGGCFFKRARQRAATSDLLVVNHALLAIHLYDDSAGLPPFDALVIDEAHAFVGASLDHLTRSIGPARMALLVESLPDARLPSALVSGEGESRYAALTRGAHTALGAAREMFGKRNGGRPAGDPRQRYREPGELETLCPLGFEPFAHALGVLDADAAALATFLERQEGEREPALDAFVAVFERFAEQVRAARRDLDDLLHPDPADAATVHWKEWGRDDAFSLNATPLEIGDHLGPALDRGPTRVVFTSATLAAGDDFSFFAAETGLGGSLHTVAFPSPFEYERQVLALAVKSAPDPRDPAGPAHTAGILHELMTRIGRPMLALFTSYRDLDAVAAALSERTAAGAYSVLVQGEGESPAGLLRRFRRDRGVLLGTASFWQGIDLPGDALEMLVVARLPFGVPTDPRLEARSERVERDGGNPFMDLYLPDAVLRFKQGFGRLIRRRTDRGVVAVLDPRLASKAYGRRFLRALPTGVTVVPDGAALVERATSWWEETAAEGDSR